MVCVRYGAPVVIIVIVMRTSWTGKHVSQNTGSSEFWSLPGQEHSGKESGEPGGGCLLKVPGVQGQTLD